METRNRTKTMSKVEIYTKSWCPYCARAKQHLTDKGIVFDEIDVTTDTDREAEMRDRAGRHTVPQIFIDGQHVGGSDDLIAADRSGRLDSLLASDITGEAA